MKAEAVVISKLNIILKNELTAINQYFLHSRMIKDWGFERLAAKIYEEFIRRTVEIFCSITVGIKYVEEMLAVMDEMGSGGLIEIIRNELKASKV